MRGDGFCGPKNRVAKRIPICNTLGILVYVSLAGCTQDLTGNPKGPSETDDQPPQIIFAEDFEDGDLSVWDDGFDPDRHHILNDAVGANGGSRYLDITYVAGGDGGWLTKFFMPGFDSIYVSYSVKLEPDWIGATKLGTLYGSRTDNRWSGMGQAGKCPTGSDFFFAGLTTVGGDPGEVTFYTYWPDMPTEPDGVTCWGRLGERERVQLTPGQWHRIEHWVRLNDSPTGANSLQQFWIDGQIVGNWSGLRLRSSDVLRLNAFQFSANISSGSTRDQHLYLDDIVISTTKRPEGY